MEFYFLPMHLPLRTSRVASFPPTILLIIIFCQTFAEPMVKPLSLGFLVQRRNNSIPSHPTDYPFSQGNRNGQLMKDTVSLKPHKFDSKKTTNSLNMTQFKKFSQWSNNINSSKTNPGTTTQSSHVKNHHLQDTVKDKQENSQHQTVSKDFNYVHTTMHSVPPRLKNSSTKTVDFASYQQQTAKDKQLKENTNIILTKPTRHTHVNGTHRSSNQNIPTTLMSIKNNKFRPKTSKLPNISKTSWENTSQNIPSSAKNVINVSKKPSPTKKLLKTVTSPLVHSSTVCLHCIAEQDTTHVHKTSRSVYTDKDRLATHLKNSKLLPSSVLAKAKFSTIEKKKESSKFPYSKTTIAGIPSKLLTHNAKLQSTFLPIKNSDQPKHVSTFLSSSVPSFHSTHFTFLKTQPTPKPQPTTTNKNIKTTHNFKGNLTHDSLAMTSISPTSKKVDTSVTNKTNIQTTKGVVTHPNSTVSSITKPYTTSILMSSIFSKTNSVPKYTNGSSTTTFIPTSSAITPTTRKIITSASSTTDFNTSHGTASVPAKATAKATKTVNTVAKAITSTTTVTTTTTIATATSTTTTTTSKPTSFKPTTTFVASSTSPPLPLPDTTTFPFTSTGKRLGTTQIPVLVLSTVLVPFTTRKPHIPSYIIVRVTTSWYQFCQNKSDFCQEISQILEKALKTPFNSSHISFINAEFSKCLDLTSAQNMNDDRVIDIKLYILNSRGEYDQSLTERSWNFISLNFGKNPKSRFFGMIKSVKLKQLNADAPNMETVVTIAIVLTTIGGLLCLVLLVLQIIVHRRRCQKLHMYMPSRKMSMGSLDSIALGTMAQSRPSSGLYNAGMEPADHAELSHPLNYRGLKNMCNDTDRIYDEFQLLPNICPKHSDLPLGVEEKNRYIDVLPIPETRVKLKTIPGEENSDYINANFITGPNEERRAYIATQAPLECTVADFWRMVWEQQARVIVMLTDMDERGMPKGTPYCPDAEDVSSVRLYGDHQVILRKKDFKPEYIVSNLELKDMENNLVRKLKHYWYTSWPAQGFPEPISFLKFILDVRLNNENKLAPLVVHCSSGTGRTGTLIAIDAGMKMFDKTQTVDVLNFVYSMRLERPRAVQTKQQYALIYKALLEYATMVMSPSISSTSSRTTGNAVTYT
ncbi:mucin-5AC [Octopus bimaculoides]|nr:mucin-5AC [Octopus bimaculoides]XP_052832985.1 mucin-5AC [Octopus bimaculoides]|eukprot:XP_014773723.1 PREDICTED: mucin-5AC-like [Octopus bimaculoides]